MKTQKQIIIEIIQNANDKFWNESKADYQEEKEDEELTESYFDDIAEEIIKSLNL